MLQKLEFGREMLASLHSSYMTRISVEVAATSNRINKTMKKLTSVATIILPMTLVTGLFGMNVTVPGQTSGAYGANPEFSVFTGFFTILLCMAIFSMLLICVFRKKKLF